MTAVTNTSANHIRGADLTSEDDWTETLDVGPGHHYVSFNVRGTFVAEVTCQSRRRDNDFIDLCSVTDADTEADRTLIIEVVGPCVMQAGIKTGDYTSGTAEVEIAGV